MRQPANAVAVLLAPMERREPSQAPITAPADLRLRELAARAWTLHRRAETEGLRHLVRPSIPILLFGDSSCYLRAPLKVITVALNPSRKEFPSADPFVRFPRAPRLSDTGEMEVDAYLASLNDYFRSAPYTGWFNPSFEELLRGMGVSYYHDAKSVALHTDLCSPLATDPTWSRLDPAEREALEPEGRRLWHDLVDTLRPDIVLISVRRDHMSKIRFPSVEEGRVIYTVDGPTRSRPYDVEACRRQLGSGKETLFVYGRAARTPFGSVSGADKRLIGARVLELFDA